MTRVVARLVAPLLAAAVVLHAPSAGAQDQDGQRPRGTAGARSRATEAREAFEQARQAFERKSYTAAAAAFEESASYALHPAPLVNAADAWTRAGDPVRAARACDRALAIGDIDLRTRALAEAQLGQVLPRVATLEIAGGSRVALRIDGSDAGVAPLRMRLSPGSHVVEAIDLSKGSTRRMVLVLDPGVTTTRTLDGEVDARRPSAETSRPTGSKPDGGPPLLTYASYGVAAVGFGIGIYFGVSTLDARGRWGDTGSADARSDFYRDRALTNVALGIGLVGAVVGTIVWLSERSTKHASAMAHSSGVSW